MLGKNAFAVFQEFRVGQGIGNEYTDAKYHLRRFGVCTLIAYALPCRSRQSLTCRLEVFIQCIYRVKTFVRLSFGEHILIGRRGRFDCCEDLGVGGKIRQELIDLEIVSALLHHVVNRRGLPDEPKSFACSGMPRVAESAA